MRKNHSRYFASKDVGDLGMLKGQLKKKKRYFSLLVVPPSTSQVRSIKVSAFRMRLVVLFVILLLSSLISFSVYSFYENKDLAKRVSALDASNQQQDVLLRQKTADIEALRTKEEEADRLATDFAQKYRDMASNYVTSRADVIRDIPDNLKKDKVFIQDLIELKKMLDDFCEATESDEALSDELEEVQAKLKEYTRHIPTQWPASGKISSPYNMRSDPFTGRSSFHDGIDIDAGYGDDIWSAADGTVVFAGYDSVYGRMLIIDHGNGLKTKYGHASELLVKEGATVKKGKLIARVGSSGRSTGAHLHFTIFLNDSPVNPLKYLD